MDMKLGIMQPYFFPYIGYFSLIKYVDKFILFDTPQYISHGWINRNRILNQNGEAKYITVPIQKASQNTKILDVKIDNTKKWKESILGSLTVYKRKAPYYEVIEKLVKKILTSSGNNMTELNYTALIETCYYLGIKTPIEIYSGMNVELREEIKAPDEWALNITKELGYKVYVNLPGGQSFFDKRKYEKENIRLEFIENSLPVYIQRIGHFEKGLSIIDVMMFCDVNSISEMLDDYRIIC